MHTSLQDKLLDLFFDGLDFVEKHKKPLQTTMAIILLGSSFGFASASVIPTVENDQLINLEEKTLLAQEQEAAEQLHASAEAEQKMKEGAIEEKMTMELIQAVYTDAILNTAPQLCNDKLEGKYINLCQENYWSIQASLEQDPLLCDNISNLDAQAECKTSAGTENSLLTDANIQKKSEACLEKEGEKNQQVCWNSLYFSIAINQADPKKCENIKDMETQKDCINQSNTALNNTTKEEAKTKKDIALCDTITDTNVKNTCVNEVTETLLTDENCDAACLTEKAKKLALEQQKTSICNKITDNTERLSCIDTTLNSIASVQEDSRICEKISSDTIQTSCISQIDKNNDKNPAVQEAMFLESKRSFPELGASLINPLEANPFRTITETQNEETSLTSEDITSIEEFSSVLDALNNFETSSSTNSTNTSINTNVCNVYASAELKTACEDSLILQEAIGNKDLTKCKYLNNPDTQDYCELEIVQGDAMRAAEQAKAQCFALSSDTAQQKCLKTLGFLSKEVTTVETAQDCLEYADPADRIACMREVKETSEAVEITE